MKMEWLTGRNGLQVPGWNGIDGEKIVVIMAHGFGSAKEGFTPKFMNLGLKKAGIGFYGFDFPAPGDSPSTGTASPSSAASTAIRRRNSGRSSWRRTPRSATLAPALARI